MSFYEQLAAATAQDRAALYAAPAITAAMDGTVTRELYTTFLTQAYHHVRHTTPLLMALGSRLPPRLAWCQRSVAEYIKEEIGHEEWILNDLSAVAVDAHFDREAIRNSSPDLPAEVMVAYAWNLVERGNPAGFFGMVYVLEGTSVALALNAADRIQTSLGLPDSAFTYLRSHGTLDLEHTRLLADLLERMGADDQAAVVHCAKVFFKLYGDIFRGLTYREAA